MMLIYLTSSHKYCTHFNQIALLLVQMSGNQIVSDLILKLEEKYAKFDIIFGLII